MREPEKDGWIQWARAQSRRAEVMAERAVMVFVVVAAREVGGTEVAQAVRERCDERVLEKAPGATSLGLAPGDPCAQMLHGDFICGLLP